MEAARRARTAARRTTSLEYNVLTTATLCLLAVGAVMVYSASSAPSLLQGGSGMGTLLKFLLYGAIGLLAMRHLARNGLERARPLTGPLLAASFVLVLAVHLPHIGVSVNGARRWLGFGPLQFQPSELMKLALVLYVSELVARRPGRVRDLRELMRPLLAVVACALLLVASQPDIGTAMVIGITVCALLLAAGMRGRDLALLLAIAGAAVLLYALVQPYSRARLTSFVDPWAHAGTTGYQSVQGQIAIGSGGLFGRGPGQSVQKAFYLPEASTDFILAVIGEELGALGVCALLFLYGMIAFAGMRVARRARSLYSALVAVGVTALIVSQALVNAFAVLGLGPLTGVPLPLVSYGASSMVVTLCAMGLLLNVASGATVHVRAVPERGSPRDRRRPATGADRGGWDRGARGAGARGRRGAAR